MKKYIHLILFIISCPVFCQQKFILEGEFKDTTVKKLFVSKKMHFLSNELYYTPMDCTVYNKNNKFRLELDINKPTTLQISGWNYTDLYVLPGDSVFAEVRENIIGGEKTFSYNYFTGTNAAHYNYNTELSKKFSKNDSPNYWNSEDPVIYKKEVQFWRDKKLDFLNEYKSKYPISGDFYKYAEADIQNEYVYYLYDPISSKLLLKENMPLGYLEDDTIIENVHSHYWSCALNYKYITTYSDNIYNDLESIYKNIINNTVGDTRSCLLALLIGNFSLKQGLEYKATLLNIIEKSSNYIKDEELLTYINNAKQYYTAANNTFSDEILDNTFLINWGDNKQLSLKDLLKKYAGRYIYIDCWASWCGPCRYHISKSKKVKDYLKNNNAVIVYISIDENAEQWAKASKDENILENQYLLSDPNNSPFAKEFEFKFIPRYLIVNPDGHIIDLRALAPLPENIGYFKEILSPKKVTFF